MLHRLASQTAVLLCLGFSQGALGDTVPNGGDRLREVFVKGRELAALMTIGLDEARIPSDVASAARAFLTQNRLALSADISRSRHVWSEDRSQATCAVTTQMPEADVVLSWFRCDDEGQTPIRTAQLLVHESVHHFGVGDEALADQVAEAVVRTWTLQRVEGDWGFRFEISQRRCVNERAEQGYNKSYRGECGSFYGEDLSHERFDGQTMRGADFTFATGYRGMSMRLQSHHVFTDMPRYAVANILAV